MAQPEPLNAPHGRGLSIADTTPIYPATLQPTVANDRRDGFPRVTNISRHGFWLLVDGRELFLPFEEFPWFKRAPVEAILHLKRPAPDHVYWPELDVDLPLDSIEHPDRYPLKPRP